VLDPLVHKALWKADPREFVEEATCTIRSRLGQLADGKDRWWTSSDTDAVEQVRELLIAYGIPFLERATSRAELGAWLEDNGVTRRRYPVPIISLAIIKLLLGERSDGLQLLQDLRSKTTPPWRDRIDAILDSVTPS
jgi:hypothetical protein